MGKDFTLTAIALLVAATIGFWAGVTFVASAVSDCTQVNHIASKGK